MFEDMIEMLEQEALSIRVRSLMEYHLITPTYLAYCSEEIFSAIMASSVLQKKYRGMDMVMTVTKSTVPSKEKSDIYLTWHGRRLGAHELYRLCS